MKTGLAHRPGDASGLSDSIRLLVEQPELRMTLGCHARVKAVRSFSTERIAPALLEFYGGLGLNLEALARTKSLSRHRSPKT